MFCWTQRSLSDVRQLPMSVLHPPPLDDASTKPETVAALLARARSSRHYDAQDFVVTQPTTMRAPEHTTVAIKIVICIDIKVAMKQ